MKSKLIIVAIFSGILLLCVGAYIWYSHAMQTQKPNAYISVTESNNKDVVYVDNNSIGTTPLISKTLPAGEHTIKIIHSINASSYITFQKTLTFASKTNTVITMTLGPNDIYTGYSILSLSPTQNSSGILILNDTPSSDALITINALSVSLNTIIHKDPGSYELTVTQDGYVPLHNEIQLPKGYVMTEIVHLFKKPIG